MTAESLVEFLCAPECGIGVTSSMAVISSMTPREIKLFRYLAALGLTGHGYLHFECFILATRSLFGNAWSNGIVNAGSFVLKAIQNLFKQTSLPAQSQKVQF
jgi:hypothetical protein